MEKQKKKPTEDEIASAIVYGKFKPLPELREMPLEHAQLVSEGVRCVQQKFGLPDVEDRFHQLDEEGQVDFIRDLSLTPFNVSLELRKGLGLAIGRLWRKIVRKPSISNEIESLGIGFRQFAVPIMAATRNILMNGAIIASPSTDPPYYYHWPRDAALCMRSFIDLAQISGHPAIERIADKICDFTHRVQDTTGKWSQRYTVEGDGTYEGAKLWADPQMDGIANSMIALSRYVRYATTNRGLTLENPRVRKAVVAMIRGCGYLLEKTNEPSWGLWEERLGFHQYTTLAIRRAFKEFTELYDALGLGRMDNVEQVIRFSEDDSENSRAWEYIRNALKTYTTKRERKDEFPEGVVIDESTEREVLTSMYKIAISEVKLFDGFIERYKGASPEERRELEHLLERNLEDDEDYRVSNKNLVRVNIPNAPNIGSASIGAVLHFGGMEYDDPYLMSNFMLLDEVFSRIYTVNRERGTKLWGRYLYDLYDGRGFTGGNPWFICSLWSVQYHYNLAAKYITDGEIVVRDPKQARLLSRVVGEDIPIGVIRGDDESFNRITDALIEEGDKRFRDVMKFIPEDGSIGEQIDKNTGEPRGAEHLTWSYDEFLQTIRDRAMVGKLRKITSVSQG